MNRCERGWWNWRGRSRVSGIGGCMFCWPLGRACEPQASASSVSASWVDDARKKRKHCARLGQPRRVWTAANQEWAVDFLHDAVECGRAIRVLSVVDAYTRGCLALEVDTSFASRKVTRVLDRIVAERGQPKAIRCDNGRELTSRHFLAWCVERQIELVHIQPGKPTRESSRTAAGRMLGGELVSKLVRWAAEDRRVEDRIERGAPAQQFEISHAERICGGQAVAFYTAEREARESNAVHCPRAPPRPAQLRDGPDVSCRILT